MFRWGFIAGWVSCAVFLAVFAPQFLKWSERGNKGKRTAIKSDESEVLFPSGHD